MTPADQLSAARPACHPPHLTTALPPALQLVDGRLDLEPVKRVVTGSSDVSSDPPLADVEDGRENLLDWQVGRKGPRGWRWWLCV